MFDVTAEIDNINEVDRGDYSLDEMLSIPGFYRTKYKNFAYVMIFTRNTALLIRRNGEVQEFNPGQWRGQAFTRVSRVNITIKGKSECVQDI